MLTWRNKTKTPLGGWRYLVPETGVLITGPHWGALLSNVAAHLTANVLPNDPDLERRIELFMCQEIPDGCSDVPAPQVRPKKMTVGDVLRFTAMIGADMLNGRERVDKEEANRRAGICVGCPDNVDPEGCSTCNRGRMEKLIEKLTGAIATKRDAQLKSCRHCGCINKAQVWFPLDLLQKFTNTEVNEALPTNCWKKK
jgi:hypothetical protein